MDPASSQWRPCSSCKTAIPFETTYWVCNVSTCNRKRVGLFFCSVPCWEAHLPSMRHREAWAVEKRSPSQAAWEREQREEEQQPRAAERPQTGDEGRVRKRVGVSAATAELDDDVPQDILIVVSKLKKYIRARSGMNTSDTVMPVLSAHLRRLCDQAIRHAGQNERKTVLDRDFTPFTRDS